MSRTAPDVRIGFAEQGGERVALRSGRSVVVRPIRAADKPSILEAFERLSPESRYRRFLHPMTELSADDLAYLTEVDHRDHEAIVALESERGCGVGVARYVRWAHDPPVAEVAVTVVDDWQGMGLGTLLLERLADRAREEGIRRFSALVQAGNRRSVELLRTLGEVFVERSGPDLLLTIDLPERWGLGARLAMALRQAATSAISAHGLAERMREQALVLTERTRERVGAVLDSNSQ
jgi:L-amino acid N-acyltransferase YncA